MHSMFVSSAHLTASALAEAMLDAGAWFSEYVCSIEEQMSSECLWRVMASRPVVSCFKETFSCLHVKWSQICFTYLFGNFVLNLYFCDKVLICSFVWLVIHYVWSLASSGPASAFWVLGLFLTSIVYFSAVVSCCLMLFRPQVAVTRQCLFVSALHFSSVVMS